MCLNSTHSQLTFSLEQFLSFIILSNVNGDMISFKLLIYLYMKITVLSEKNCCAIAKIGNSGL